MSSDHWEEVRDVFSDALALPSEDRRAFVRKALAGKPELADEVESLLTSYDDGEGVLDRPAARVSDLGDAPDLEGEPEIIGGYAVLRRLGAGGMGAVYLAERDDSYRNRVAIKLLKRGLDSEEILRRFRAEGRILASLHHQGITRVLEGGVHTDGRPYFVLEYVADGEPIDLYCERNGLGLAARLELFRHACDAVQYAHRRLIIHRDLKPSNLLVSGAGEVKLLDFGIAKLLDPAAVDVSRPAATRRGIQPMTLDYASPEQLRGETLTTASDVYSLGVILYELVAGRRPFPVDDPTVPALQRAITKGPPQPPSAAATVESGPVSVSELRGDLDNIVLMALRLEPEERYSSVESLSADLGRYLEQRPVAARPLTAGYRLRRYVQRNAVAVSLGGLAVVALLAGAVGMAWQARVARDERDRARVAQAQAERVADVLTGLFDLSDPGRQSGGATMTVREFADLAEGRVLDELDEPGVRAQLQTVMARLNLSLARYDRAEELFEGALAEQRRLHPEGDLELADTLAEYSKLLLERQEYDRAEVVAREALAIRRRLLGEDDLGVSDLLVRLASVEGYRGREARADELLRQALEIRQRLLPPDDPRIADSLGQLAVQHYRRAQYPQAIDLCERALEIHVRAHGEVHQSVAHELNNLGAMYQAAGDLRRAAEIHARALEVRTAVYGADHLFVSYSKVHLGRLALTLGRPVEAIESFERAVEIREAAYGREHRRVADTLVDLAAAMTDLERYARAEALLDESVEIHRRTGGGEHPRIARALVARGLNLCEWGRCVEAIDGLREAVAIEEGQQIGHPIRLATARAALGRALVARGELQEAGDLLGAATRAFEKHFPEGHVEAAPAYVQSAALARLLGDDAGSLVAERRALAVLEATLPPEHLRIAEAKRRLASLD